MFGGMKVKDIPAQFWLHPREQEAPPEPSWPDSFNKQDIARAGVHQLGEKVGLAVRLWVCTTMVLPVPPAV